MKALLLIFLPIMSFAQIDSAKIKHRNDSIKAHLDGQKYIADKIKSQHKIDSMNIAKKKPVKQPSTKPKSQ